MIFYRGWEIKKGKVMMAVNMEEPLFPTQEIVEIAQKCYSCVPKEHISRALGKTSIHGKKILQKSITALENTPIKKRAHEFIDNIKGRQVIRQNAKPSSAFIQDILAHKEHIRNNK